MTEDTSHKHRRWPILILVLAPVLLWAFLNYGQKGRMEAPRLISEGTLNSAEPSPQAIGDASEDNSKVTQTDEIIPPSFDVVRVEPDGTAVIAGQANPGGRISVQVDGIDLHGATAQVGPDGRFVMITDVPQKATVQKLDLVFQPEDGATIVRSSERIFIDATQVTTQVASISADQSGESNTPAGVAPTDQSMSSETPRAPTLLLADDDGVRVVSTAQEPAAVKVVALDTISYTNSGDVSIGGRANVDGRVRVYLDNSPITVTDVADSGYWSIDLPDVDAGVYTLRVDEVAPNGEVSSRIETPFKREERETLQALLDQSESGLASYTVKTVQPGATLWAIAEERYGDGMAFVKVFEANKDRIKDPDLIYPGQVFDTPD